MLQPWTYYKYHPAFTYSIFYRKQAEVNYLKAGDVLKLYSKQLGYADSMLYVFKLRKNELINFVLTRARVGPS